MIVFGNGIARRGYLGEYTECSRGREESAGSVPLSLDKFRLSDIVTYVILVNIAIYSRINKS